MIVSCSGCGSSTLDTVWREPECFKETLGAAAAAGTAVHPETPISGPSDSSRHVHKLQICTLIPNKAPARHPKNYSTLTGPGYRHPGSQSDQRDQPGHDGHGGEAQQRFRGAGGSGSIGSRSARVREAQHPPQQPQDDVRERREPRKGKYCFSVSLPSFKLLGVYISVKYVFMFSLNIETFYSTAYSTYNLHEYLV